MSVQMPTRSRLNNRNRMSPQLLTEKGSKKGTSSFRKWIIPSIGAVGFIAISLLIYHANSDFVSNKNLDTKTLKQAKVSHQALQLRSTSLASLQEQINMTRLWQHLKKILIARVPGTRNSTIVRKHIVNTLRDLNGWVVEEDGFVDTAPAPYGRTRFTNIIASTNTAASRKLVLACHYDSKILPRQYFVGATDSALPCAMLLELAHVLHDLTTEHTVQQILNRSAIDISLDLIFFDGEEAFVSWTDRDSIYGARNLAAKWSKRNAQQVSSTLDKIDLFVLLDLIGHEATSFVNFFVTQSRWFDHARSIEERLFRGISSHRSIFPRNTHFEGHRIEDDHIPFLHRGVPVMHLISFPFPGVWHKPTDDESALHRPRIEEITRVLAVFVAEYMHMDYPPK